MPHAKTMDATRICEEILRADRRYNDEHECLSSETAIIDRLLDRRLELVEAYVELHTSLASRQHALEVFFGLLVSTAAFWSPDDVSRARSGRARLIQVNALIARKAEELALLLDERSELHEDSGFSGATHYHVARVIEEAASANHLFRMWVRDQLAGLRGQFSLKYWPTISEFVRVLGRDAARSEPEATDPITEAAAKGVRGSLADFFKALFQALEENSEGGLRALPAGFRPSDATIASLANCALDLGPDDLVDAAYVKRLRQRQREGTQKQDRACA